MLGWTPQINYKYEVNSCNGALVEGKPIIFNERKSSVCLVSCHGINHYRGVLESDVKVADLYTGSIVEVVSELIESLFVSNVCRTSSINPYLGMTEIELWLKKRVKENPRLLVVDIHGCKNNSDFDFAFGTCVSPAAPKVQDAIEIIAGILNREGVRSAINPKGYSAKSKYTLTRSLINLRHKNVIQIEISRRFREPKEKLNTTINLLAQAIKRIKYEL